jgi:hypothetical protein
MWHSYWQNYGKIDTMTRFQKLLGKNLAQNNLEAIEWLEEKIFRRQKMSNFSISHSQTNLLYPNALDIMCESKRCMR